MLANQRSATWTRRRVSDSPSLNISDVPEMMPGAQPSANSVARERFEQRCVSLWKDAKEDNRQASEARAVCRNHDIMERHAQLEKIFPNLDTELIWSMCQEAQSVQDAVDTLLALSASMSAEAADLSSAETADQVDGAASSATKSARPATQHVTNQEDAGAWPALVGSDGWEVVNYHALQQQEQDLGSAWCKTAKDAVPLPAPTPTASMAVQPRRKQKEPPGATPAMEFIGEDELPTDYQVRHMRGQMRATKRATRPTIKAAVRGTALADDDTDDDSVDEGNPVEQKEQNIMVSDSENSSDTLSEATA